jgi:sortase A
MKPDEPNSQGGMSLSQQGSLANTPAAPTNKSPQEAATNVIRSQIENIYAQSANSGGNPSPDKSQLTEENPYLKTHSDTVSIQTNDWKQYHSAWQNYYQKYYEGYYSKHLNSAKKALQNRNRSDQNGGYFDDNPALQAEEPITKDEALFEMRQDLIGKVTASARKIKKSRHFVPIMTGAMVVLFFLFMQYNRTLIANVAAYVSPGSIDPQNIVIDPNADLTVPPEPKLIIPKINVDVPVIYDIGNDYDSQMTAMTKGVAHFAIPGASSHPGQIGNTVIAGHSSNDLLDPGDYKFIFAQLDKLEVGDTIYANYNSKRYTYTVTKKEVVSPSEVSKLVYATTKPVLTLLTCTPLGTALNRLLVTAEQVSPDPTQSAPAPQTKATTNKSIPGNSPTFFERLFGNNG